MKKTLIKGFTLIEIMVALFISGVLFYAITKMLIQNKQVAMVQTNLDKIQNDSRFAFEVMGQDLRSSAFRGCISGSNTTNFWVNFKNVAGTANYQNSIIGVQGSSSTGTSWSPAPDASITALSPAPSPAYDILTVRNAGINPAFLTADMTSATSAMTVNSTTGLTAGSYAIISNCGASSLFQVASAGSGSVTSNSATGVNFIYKAGAQIYPYNTVIYYVAASGTDNILYRQINGGTPEPIVNGVDKFMVLYGVDTVGNYDATKYVYASGVTNPSQVVSVRIDLVLRSADNNISAAVAGNNTYVFNGATVAPGDRKLRKEYYTTINLRNMVP
jgi:type IV pilus assembly protein PilW